MIPKFEEKKEQDSLFEKLNHYHPKIKLTIEKNLMTFLDTKITRHGYGIKTNVYNNPKKLPGHWSSKIPTRYKGNAQTCELHRAKRIANNKNLEIKRITKSLY